MRKVFYDDHCETFDNQLCGEPWHEPYFDEGGGKDFFSDRDGKCRDCICRACGSRDMTVCCEELCEHSDSGGNCLVWAGLAVLTCGLALLIPLIFGNRFGGRRECRKVWVAVCCHCGHRQCL